MKSLDLGRYALSSCAAAALLAGCGGTLSSGAIPLENPLGASLPYHHTFKFTGKRQSFKVPPGVTSITVVARGASGGLSPYYTTRSGRGARVYAVIPVRAGETLHVYVGGAGYYQNGWAVGGFNGGGNPAGCCMGGFGGGGASDVREGGTEPRDRILVAAGGGGEGGYENSGGAGGAGGGVVGGAGSAGSSDSGDGGGGGGATQNRGGSGGVGGQKSCYSCSHGQNGKSGRRRAGGDGGNGGPGDTSSATGGAGGGGGGGYFGGGGGGGGEGGGGGAGGSAGGGGGGGSSYVEPTATSVRMWTGWKNATGNGLVVFSWQ
ncbi:MAG TPA: hypothetical protein VMU38_06165 [Candidatus Binatia bacterium]|nr:hypothetical protein [Candidatus Binatia bacterium]